MRLQPPEVSVNQTNQIVERRRAVSEAFHSFHQPLTSLHCGLELALSKPRNEGEYRKRIEDALVNAGQILRLNKALRELVDAPDPGERFGTVAFDPLIAQLREEIALVADAAGVSVEFAGDYHAQVAADPMKLIMMLGNLFSGQVSRTAIGGTVKITGEMSPGVVTLFVQSSHLRDVAPNPSDMDVKLREIRLDAARTYIEVIGGTFSMLENGVEITFPTRS
jgi:hypothetical protein